eukprot:gnl/MRDRNA2_/MRDRNA2_100051_c0_seq1.p1 gnl/MRDRNA2_/MRDRNA2_100051_c0~~gnl/MRDRNA2_/MRDRNA2_100051_c0_seq1.p1  ORF type:complete len:350 (-),score=69.64 gnl/MRDRNA2_/MRDRNA2_100051_c0_seq1:83-1132(-)
MGRKKINKDEETAEQPKCEKCNSQLERLIAPLPYECDKCQADIFRGACYFGCVPCDWSLCGACYVNQASAIAEAAEKAEKFAHLVVPEGVIHPEIWALCEQYEIADRLVTELNDNMRHRHETWKEDMEKLHMDFRSATRSVNGLLVRHINDMKRGLFHGKYPPAPEIARVIKEYQLDQDAREKLTDLLQKRERAGNDWKKDLWETEQRLKTAKNPSMMALTMVVCIQQGKEPPPLKERKDVVKQYDERHGHSDRNRDRSRGDRRQRHRSRDKEWGTSSSGHRDDRRNDDRGDDDHRRRGDGRNQGHHRDRREGRDDSRGRNYKSGGHGGGGSGGEHGGGGGQGEDTTWV